MSEERKKRNKKLIFCETIFHGIHLRLLFRYFLLLLPCILRKISLRIFIEERKRVLEPNIESPVSIHASRESLSRFLSDSNSFERNSSSKRHALQGSGDPRSRSFPPSLKKRTQRFHSRSPSPLRGRRLKPRRNLRRFCFRNIRCVTPVSSNVRPSLQPSNPTGGILLRRTVCAYICACVYTSRGTCLTTLFTSYTSKQGGKTGGFY